MNYKEQIRNVKDYIRLPLCYNHWYVAGLVGEFGAEPVAKTPAGKLDTVLLSDGGR